MARIIKVLVVDDSPLVQQLITDILNQAPDIKVVGVADDPYDARDKIKQLQPDVLTLDVEMPRMNGIAFLKNLMRLRPMPVVMVSTLTEKGAPVTMEALELGAVDFVPKPKMNVETELVGYREEIHEKIRAAALSRVRSLTEHKSQQSAGSTLTNLEQLKFQQRFIVAIGASTGGTEAIKQVITRFPKHFSPVVITQHIPPVFSSSFAQRMDGACQMHVQEATDGMPVEAGNIYIAPGDHHLEVVMKSGRMYCHVFQGEKVNRHRPSVDVMFNSVMNSAGMHSTAAILTGMGSDGAQSLLAMKQSGIKTIAQDEESCVVYGMPRAAAELNAATKIAPLDRIADLLMRTALKS